MPLAALYQERSSVIGLFPAIDQIAFEQHFSLAPTPKLALSLRRVKLNVAKTQHMIFELRAPR
jgi:hypothetical protein